MRRRALADRFGGEFDHDAGVALNTCKDGAQRIDVDDAERKMVEADVGAAVERGGTRAIGNLPKREQGGAVGHEYRGILRAFGGDGDGNE